MHANLIAELRRRFVKRTLLLVPFAMASLPFNRASALTTTTGSGDMIFSAQVSAGVTLDIQGGTDTGNTATTTVLTGGTLNTVAFGQVSSTCTAQPTGTGSCSVVSATAGNVYATLVATVTYSGFTDYSIGISRPAPVAGDFPTGQMLFATGTGNDWTLAGTGAAISETATPSTLLASGGPNPSGTATPHQIAARINSTDAGNFSSTVTYLVTGIP